MAEFNPHKLPVLIEHPNVATLGSRTKSNCVKLNLAIVWESHAHWLA